MMSPIPAQKRLLMMLQRKLKSLFANTTGKQESDITSIQQTDFINKYGDRIVAEYLYEHPHINEKLLDPIGALGREEWSDSFVKENLASSVSGKVALLTVKEQREFYEEVADRYISLIKYLDDTDSNDLEIKTYKFDAVTLSSTIVAQGTDNTNPFSSNTVLEHVEINVLKKPMRVSEIIKEIERNIDGEFNAQNKLDYILKVKQDVRSFYEDKEEKALNKIEESYVNKEQVFMEKSIVQVNKEAELLKLTDRQREESLAELEFIMEYNRKLVAKEDVFEMKKKIDFILNEKYPDSTLKRDFREEHFQMLERKNNSLFFSGEKLRQNRRSIEELVRTLGVGTVYRVPQSVIKDGDNGAQGNVTNAVPAVFLGFTYKESNMMPSSVKLNFATRDGRRKIQIPLSEKDPISYIKIMGEDKSITLSEWDSMIVDNLRTKRYLMTGNLIQGVNLAKYSPIVSYTKRDGSIGKRLLMPENYNPESQSKRISIAEAYDSIISGGRVDSSDFTVSFEKLSPWLIKFMVPASAKEGSKYYLNPSVTSLVSEGYFRQQGGRMVANVPIDNLRSLLNYLKNNFNLSVDVAPSSDSRKIRSIITPNFDYESIVDEMIKNGEVRSVDMLTEKPCR